MEKLETAKASIEKLEKANVMNVKPLAKQAISDLMEVIESQQVEISKQSVSTRMLIEVGTDLESRVSQLEENAKRIKQSALQG